MHVMHFSKILEKYRNFTKFRNFIEKSIKLHKLLFFAAIRKKMRWHCKFAPLQCFMHFVCKWLLHWRQSMPNKCRRMTWTKLCRISAQIYTKFARKSCIFMPPGNPGIFRNFAKFCKNLHRNFPDFSGFAPGWSWKSHFWWKNHQKSQISLAGAENRSGGRGKHVTFLDHAPITH